MHYRNGRVAHNGDRVMLLNYDGQPVLIGILYDAVAGNDSCNGQLAAARTSDPCPNLKDCLHADDVAAVLKALGTGLPSSIQPEV